MTFLCINPLLFTLLLVHSKEVLGTALECVS